MPIDLSQVSIASPLLVESDDRRRNLERFLDYYGTIGENVEVIVVGQSNWLLVTGPGVSKQLSSNHLQQVIGGNNGPLGGPLLGMFNAQGVDPQTWASSVIGAL